MDTITPAPADAAGRTAPVVRACGVTRDFGLIKAVDRVDLEIEGGELFGLIGHNGAGKSTLFKMMLGLLPVSEGEILIHDKRVGGRDFRAVRRDIGYLPENVVLYDNLTGLETLRFFARLKHAPGDSCAAALEQVGLAHAGHRPVREYSKGMRQRLGFAQALLGKPRLLFLDEPTNGLDPEAIRAFYATLRALRDDGVTIVLTSHILSEIQERVDRLAIMAAGRIQALGTVQALREQVDLPLNVVVQIHHDQAAAVRALVIPLGVADIPGAEPAGEAGEPGTARLRFACPRPLKMKLLGALANLGEGLIDVTVHEPSLEDVFFGFAD